MHVVTSFNQLNYREILPQFARAARVTIVTYSLDIKRNGDLWKALQSLPRTARLTLIASIPASAVHQARQPEGDSARQIGNYYSALDPGNFPCPTRSFVSLHNHAKIVRCDDMAYVGSANFSTASAKNFEAGCLITDEDNLARVNAFISQIRDRAIPHQRVRGSKYVQYILQFGADARWLAEEVRSIAFEEYEVYKDVWKERFTMAGFGIPDHVMETLQRLEMSWAAIVQKLRASQHLTQGEQAFCNSGVNVTIENLLASAKSIHGQELLPRELTTEGVEQSLLEKYSMEENPADHPALHAEAEEIVSSSNRDRERAAESEMRAFLDQLAAAGPEIFEALRA
jgi:hypothetical protein